MNISEDTLSSIGEVAHRTELSVSAIRYYADEGLVQPTDATDGGHRLYDVEAIARLEFVRTLRDLDTGLEQVRPVLAGTTSLRDMSCCATSGSARRPVPTCARHMRTSPGSHPACRSSSPPPAPT
ncbi:helix-turn-helix domain-containing protein [Microbacterium sp. NPDC003461]